MAYRGPERRTEPCPVAFDCPQEEKDLLHRGGSEHKVAVVAVASAFYHGEIVALLGGDVAEAWTSAHDIDDDAGQFRSGQVGHALLILG